ncbi:polyphosphate polymerase domain-containing protein [Ulvibacterium sp.]|uniref:polyphosphate polymerase domain-containing protein n=1 Tax=Ulvibacterium sp. TaxID=2665914 RepID=UPI003BA8CAEA
MGKNLRFERKFIYKNVDLENVIQTVFINSFCFKEVFVRRKVNNIYFDDHNYSCYKQNVSGVGKREKFRLRWYGDDFNKIKDPVFEIKVKYGEVGDKISYKMEGFQASLNELSREEIYRVISENIKKPKSTLRARYGQLQPTLYNSYERKYYLSFCGKFRITLDYNQEFFDPDSANFRISRQNIDEREIVLELKYNIEYDDEARQITQELNSRLTKNSKYVNGVERIRFLSV